MLLAPFAVFGKINLTINAFFVFFIASRKIIGALASTAV